MLSLIYVYIAVGLRLRFEGCFITRVALSLEDLKSSQCLCCFFACSKALDHRRWTIDISPSCCLDDDSVISTSRSLWVNLSEENRLNTIHEKRPSEQVKNSHSFARHMGKMAPEHFMYLGLKIWKLLGNVMVDCYLANCWICNNCSALHLQAGIEYSICEGFGLIKMVFTRHESYYVRPDRYEVL